MRQPTFKYTDNVKTVHSIACGPVTFVEVVGDPDYATYEWVIRSEKSGVVRHSDDGYGFAEAALRDGLIAHLGLPNAPQALEGR